MQYLRLNIYCIRNIWFVLCILFTIWLQRKYNGYYQNRDWILNGSVNCFISFIGYTILLTSGDSSIKKRQTTDDGEYIAPDIIFYHKFSFNYYAVRCVLSLCTTSNCLYICKWIHLFCWALLVFWIYFISRDKHYFIIHVDPF